MKKAALITLLITLVACTNFVDEKFVGQWKFYSTINKDLSGLRYNGDICQLKKFDGTNETYSFMFMGEEFIFTKKDNSTLTCIKSNFSNSFDENTQKLANENIILKYDDETERLIFSIGQKNRLMEFEFTKLK